MKRMFAVAAILFFAVESRAGIVYQFESVSEGLTRQTFAGTVKADAGNMRIDVKSGDGMFFGDGSIVLSSSGANGVTVLNPSKKTFYTLDFANLLGRATGALSQFRDLVKVDAKNPKVGARDAGAAGTLEGFAVRRSHVASSFDLVLDVFGEKTPAKVQIDSDVWTTDKLPAASANVLQTSGIRTGIESIDKVIESQATSVRGFPLKQVTITRITMRGRTTTSTTSSRVSGVRAAPIEPGLFVVPSGYRKVDSPVETLLGRFGNR